MLQLIVRRFVREDEGIEMVEWVLLATVFAVVVAGFFSTLGTSISTALTSVGNTITGS